MQQQKAIEQLSLFAFHPRVGLESFDLLIAFHRKFFLFPTHNVESERAIAQIYSYKLEAAVAKSGRVSAVYLFLTCYFDQYFCYIS